MYKQRNFLFGSILLLILVLGLLIPCISGDTISPIVQTLKPQDIAKSNLNPAGLQTPVLPSQGILNSGSHTKTLTGTPVVYAPQVNILQTSKKTDPTSLVLPNVNMVATINVKSNKTTYEKINCVKYRPPPLQDRGIGSQVAIASVNPATQNQIANIADFPYHADKKIIEYGTDAPSSRWVNKNIASMEQKPFDGLVFWSGDNAVSLFLPWDWSKYTDHLDNPNLTTINWNKFKGNNFLLLHTWTCDDWTNYWDDAYWATIESNMADLAKAAKNSGCAGILLDTEWYSTKSPWSYADMGLGHTQTETQAKIRQRGAQIMNAWQSQYQDITILTTYVVKPLYWGGDEWELLPYWMNGMLDVIGPDVRLVHSDEDAYYYSDTTTWFSIYDQLKVSKSALTYLDSTNEEKWKKNVEVGKTLYWENIMTSNPTQSMKDRWEHNAYMGLATSDKWTWVYSDALNWWDVPKEYQPTGCFLDITGIYSGTSEGLTSARQKYDAKEKLGWDWYGTSVYGTGNKDTSVKVEVNSTNQEMFTATSNNGAISKVDFYVNMILVNSDTENPYMLDTSALSDGIYTMFAQATDVNGKHGTSAPVTYIKVSSNREMSISSISPTSAYNTGTLTLTISGQNFANGATVKLMKDTNIIQSTIQQLTTSQIICTIPLEGVTAGVYNMIVTNADGTSIVKTDAFTVIAVIKNPEISSISPVKGYNSGDITVTITGSNFRTGAAIKLIKSSTIKTGTIQQLSDNQIIGTFALKGLAAGLYTLTVTNTDGTSVSKSNVFTVLAAGAVTSITRVFPNRGSNLKNLVITVTGKNFRSNTMVTITQGVINKNGIGVTLQSSTKLKCTLPLIGISKGYWSLTIKNADGTSVTKLNAIKVT